LAVFPYIYPMAIHKDLSLADAHSVVAFEYATLAARNAAVLTTGDHGKVCRVTADNTYFVLVDAPTGEWVALSGATGGAGAGMPAVVQYADLAARNAAVLTAASVGTMCLLTDSKTVYLCTDYTTPTWLRLGAGGVQFVVCSTTPLSVVLDVTKSACFLLVINVNCAITITGVNGTPNSGSTMTLIVQNGYGAGFTGGIVAYPATFKIVGDAFPKPASLTKDIVTMLYTGNYQEIARVIGVPA
jgi:hypothetical protein